MCIGPIAWHSRPRHKNTLSSHHSSKQSLHAWCCLLDKSWWSGRRDSRDATIETSIQCNGHQPVFFELGAGLCLLNRRWLGQAVKLCTLDHRSILLAWMINYCDLLATNLPFRRLFLQTEVTIVEYEIPHTHNMHRCNTGKINMCFVNKPTHFGRRLEDVSFANAIITFLDANTQ